MEHFADIIKRRAAFDCLDPYAIAMRGLIDHLREAGMTEEQLEECLRRALVAEGLDPDEIVREVKEYEAKNR